MTPDTALARNQPELSDEQAQVWAEKIETQVQLDPLHRGARWWALFMGLVGKNLDRVLLELGEPPVPPTPPVMRTHYFRRYLPC